MRETVRSSLGATLAAAALACFLAACGGGGAAGGTSGADTDPPADDGGGADAARDVAAPPTGAWRTMPLGANALEPPLRLAGAGDRAWVAGLRHTGAAAGCTLAEPPGPVQTYEIIALHESEGAWREETVASLDGGFGVGLAVDGGGAPLVAWMGGTPGEEFCGGSDLLVATRGGDAWTVATVQATSAVPGAVCAAMQDVCNTGDVTGMWPSLGVDAAGAPIVAFRDVHFGYTKEDYDSSDLEVARREAGGWRVWTVDDSAGAGRASAIAAEPASGRTYVAYTNPKDALLRLATFDGDAWTRETVATGAVAAGPPAIVVVDGAPAIVAHDGDEGTLVWFERDGDAWRRRTLDDDGVTGLEPSAAVCEDGVVQVAYRRCGRLGTDACQAAHDALKVATRRSGGWSLETVYADEEAEDGLSPAAVCGRVVFVTSRFDPATGGAISRGMLATWVTAE